MKTWNFLFACIVIFNRFFYDKGHICKSVYRSWGLSRNDDTFRGHQVGESPKREQELVIMWKEGHSKNYVTLFKSIKVNTKHNIKYLWGYRGRSHPKVTSRDREA